MTQKANHVRDYIQCFRLRENELTSTIGYQNHLDIGLTNENYFHKILHKKLVNTKVKGQPDLQKKNREKN